MTGSGTLRRSRSAPWIGVDLGQTIPAVAATPDGSIFFFKSLETAKDRKFRQFLDRLRDRYRRLGKTKEIKKIERWERSVLRRIHRRISEELVALAVRLRSGIRMENLQKGCPLQSLQSIIFSKARESGVRVEKVPPHYTTTTCHACGAYNGRKPSSFYVCAYCGYRIHVDANAAQNIRDWQGLCCPLKIRAGT